MLRAALLVLWLAVPSISQATALAVVDSIPLPGPEREGGHLLDAAMLGDHLVAAGERGLYAFDGLGWSRLVTGPAFRWVGVHDDRLLAGGEGGLWTVRASEGELQARPEGRAPRGVRSGAIAPDGGVWLGTDDGLFHRAGGDGSWEAAGPTARIDALLLHERWGVVAGSFGDGLFLRRPGAAAFEQIRCEAPGTTDGLPGDFIHALAVDGQGRLVVASSYGRLDPAFKAWQNMRNAGHIDALHPHDFRRAARSVWDGERWSVDYLVQDSGRTADPSDLEMEYQGDCDGDGRTEVWLRLSRARDLHPRGLFCFDRESGELEWSLPTWSSHVDVHVLPGTGPKRFLVGVGGVDNGYVHPGGDDSESRLWLVDGSGKILREWDLDHQPMSLSPVLDVDREPPELVALLSLSHAPEDPAELGWRFRWFDLERMDWRPGELSMPGAIRWAAWRSRGKLHALVGPAGPLSYDVEVELGPGGFAEPLAQPYELEGGDILGFFALGHPRGWIGLGRHGSRDQQIPAVGFGRATTGTILRGRPLPAGEVLWIQASGPIFGAAAALQQREGDGRFGYHLFAERTQVERGVVAPVMEWSSGASYFPCLSARTPPAQLDWLVSIPAVRELRSLGVHAGLAFLPGVGDEGLRAISTQPDATGRLPVYAGDGVVVDQLPVPPELDGQGALRWLRPYRTLPGATRAILARVNEWPLHPRLLDLRTGEVLATYDLGLPYVASGLFSVECLGPGGELVGGRGGLHAWPADDTARGVAWVLPAERLHSVREIGPATLACGDEGVLSLAPRASRVDRGVRSLVRGGGAVHWVGPSVLRRQDDGGSAMPSRTLTTDWGSLAPSGALAVEAGVLIPPNRWFPAGAGREISAAWSFHDGWGRAMHDLVQREDGRLLLAHDAGLQLVDASTSTSQPLGAAGRRYNDLQRWEGRWLAAREDGALEWVEGDSVRQAGALMSTLPSGRAVRRLVVAGNGQELWAAHPDGLSRLVPPGPTVELGEAIVSARPAAAGGIWLATAQGVERFDTERRVALHVRPPGLPAASAVEIFEQPGDAHDWLWVLTAEQELWRCPLPRAGLGGWRQDWEGDLLRARAWPPQPTAVGAVAGRRGGEGGWRELEHHAGNFSVVPRRQGRGRHRYELVAYDPYGRPSPEHRWTGTHVVRVRSAALALATQLLFAAGGAAWLAMYRSWPALWGGLLYLTLGGLWLGVLHWGLLFELPWRSSLGVGVTLATMGVVVRLAQGRPPDPRIATQRLWELVKSFHHRGGGVSPVDEARSLWRNLDYIYGDATELHEQAAVILHDLLAATEALARELEAVGRASQVDPALLQRCLGSLGGLRREALEATLDPHRLWALVRQHDRREYFLDLLQDFHRSMQGLAQHVRQRRGCELGELLGKHHRELRQRWEGQVELELALPGGGPMPVPAPYGELLEVLENLSGNAIQAMQGREGARLRLGVEREDGGRATVVVEDNGPGVPADMRERVFERGVSLRGSSGFGLFRCRQLVERWGAELVIGESPRLGGCRVEIRGLRLHG